MDTVFVNQADVTFLKYNIFPGNFLFEVTFYNVSQFNVVMGVELRFTPSSNVKQKQNLSGAGYMAARS